jgi:hypothetical protein
MDCLEFRRRLRDDPTAVDAAFLLHKRECVRCAAFAGELAALEEQLVRALRLPVPDGLAERLGLDQSLRRAWRRRRYAIAASLAVLALGGALALGVLWPRPLEVVVIDHVENEPYHLVKRHDVPVADLREIMRTIGVTVRGDLGEIRYAGLCKMRRGLGAHVVIAGHHGPVTLLVMPGETIVRPQAIRRGGLQGIIIPAGDVGIAIVGAPNEPFEAIGERVGAALWAESV